MNMISDKTKNIVDNCRFCWMCRHICPVGNATGQERNTARARALALSVVLRGAEKLENVVDNLYECTMCGACVNDCATGFDPVYATREARYQACLEGVMPKYVDDMLNKYEEKGNVYGNDLDEELPFKTQKTDVLFFVGEDTRFKSKELFNSATTLLDKAGVKYTCLKDEPNSGKSLYFLIGKADESVKEMQRCAKTLNEYKTVVVYDPEDLKFFKREYKEFGIEVSANIIGFNQYLKSLISDGKLMVKKSNIDYSIQDNFNNSRELSDSQTVRDVINSVGNIKEIYLHGKETVFAGSLLMNEYIPVTMEKVALNRWNNVLTAGATTVVTESPCEYEMLKKVKTNGIRVISVDQAILENM